MRLKVFSTQIGFHEWLVAAPSQKAALEAWDVKKNLFATGAPKVVTDKKAVELAMEASGKLVARDEAGRLAKTSRLVRLSDNRKPAAKRPARSHKKSHAKPKKAPVQKPGKANRARLDQAEHALDEFRKRATRERATIAKNRKMLELDAEALEADLDAEEKRLEAAIESARKRHEAARSS